MPDTPPPIWPFAATLGITEVLEWRTDILPFRAGEQRIALRTLPREIITLTHRLDALGLARATEMARAGFAGEWLLPMWHMAQRPGADLRQSDSEISLETGLAAFDAPSTEMPEIAAIAIGGAAAIPLAVTAIASNKLTLAAPLGTAQPTPIIAAARASIMPLRRAILAAPIEISRRRQSDAIMTATFLTQPPSDLPAPDLPTYQGAMVQTNPSLSRAPLASTLRRALEYVDNGFGPVAIEPLRDPFERSEALNFRARGPEQTHDLRRWLYALRGRQTAFWLPTWGAELQLRTAMTAGSNLMRIAPIADLGAYAERHIAVETTAGLRFRKINAAIADGENHRLTLSSSPGVALPIGAKAHFMVMVRCDADRVELKHSSVRAEVALPVVEVGS